ncbi:MAG: ATP-binding protein, partial [Gammaproteobacteria bacterium]|nr:ATP-binding protein [Gammaproteobacteria bacterium]
GLRSNNENLTKDGEIIKCEWYNTPLINDRHEVIGVASLVQDVTEQMNAIDTIHQSESNFRALFELSNQANMTLDKEKFLDCNNATLEIFGFSSKEEFMGKHPGELSPPVQPDGTASRIAADEKIAVAYKEGKNFFEWMHRRCNGEDFPAEVLLTPMKQDGKDVLQAVVVDITQRKKSEADLLEAIKSARQANQAKSEFLSRMSHELRTPLNSILGFCQLLDLKYEDPDVKSSVAEIHKAGTHLLDLINEILDLSKIEAGKLQLSIADYNFGLVLSDSLVLIELMATRSSIEIINETESYADCVIHVDYTRFKQVLINLLSNAVKYNNENGVVTISCEVVDDNRLRINIKDTGNGLTDKQQQALFKPFERLKEHNKIEGTGIGLVITRHLVENMGGEIGVDSYPGKGSTFWVEINLSESNKSDSIPIHVEVETEGSVVQGQQLLSDKTILYIEDTPANLKLVKLLIEEHTDYTMISAPEAGLGLVLAEEKQPDLILMDINLPGMSGFEAFSELQKNENTRDIPVVAISANAMQSDIEKGMSAGFEDYITKPVNVTALLTAINKFIKS